MRMSTGCSMRYVWFSILTVCTHMLDVLNHMNILKRRVPWCLLCNSGSPRFVPEAAAQRMSRIFCSTTYSTHVVPPLDIGWLVTRLRLVRASL